MEIALEKLVQLVTQQLVIELKAQGVKILTANSAVSVPDTSNSLKTKTEEPDLSAYKTPVLTEQHIRKLHVLTGEIIVPEKIKITPKAKELIKQRQITITKK